MNPTGCAVDKNSRFDFHLLARDLLQGHDDLVPTDMCEQFARNLARTNATIVAPTARPPITIVEAVPAPSGAIGVYVASDCDTLLGPSGEPSFILGVIEGGMTTDGVYSEARHLGRDFRSVGPARIRPKESLLLATQAMIELANEERNLDSLCDKVFLILLGHLIEREGPTDVHKRITDTVETGHVPLLYHLHSVRMRRWITGIGTCGWAPPPAVEKAVFGAVGAPPH